MVTLGLPVIYHPHAEHDHLKDYAATGLAAIVGRIHQTGSADLMVFVPNREPSWADAVPEGTGPHTFRNLTDPMRHEDVHVSIDTGGAETGTADNVVHLNPDAGAGQDQQPGADG